MKLRNGILSHILSLLIFVSVPFGAKSQNLFVDAFPDLQFSKPVFFVQAADEHRTTYVVEQGGRIRAFPGFSQVSSSEMKIFLDVSSLISGESGEEGLLGMALSPDYETSGIFYVYYTARTGQLISRLSRFQRNGDDYSEADSQSEIVILEIPQPYSNHNGGMLAFGPDGYLYVAVGDGGSAGDPQRMGQNKNTLLGKILRIDVSQSNPAQPYQIPDDNPFVGEENVRPEIYAYGLRNPWRFSFDRENGTGWIADVGQSAFEEINILERGGNYGWNISEGNACFLPPSQCNWDGIIRPVKDYPRSQGQSITGGYVYRGTNHPEYGGAYIYGDFVNGRIWLLRLSQDQTIATDSLLYDSPHTISSFGETSDGELVMLGYGSGRIYQFSPPVATSLNNESIQVPDQLVLHQNYPNPFNPSTDIVFDLKRDTHAELAVYSVTGQKMSVLASGHYAAGRHHVRFDASRFSSGVYIYVLKTPLGQLERRMTLLR